MTTITRGLTTPRRVVSALAWRDGALRRRDNCVDHMEQPVAIELPALRAMERDHAWVEAAANAGLRMARG